MNKKSTYKSDDIEQLLLDKSYEELSDSEKQFALTQIDSAAEYNEMRATLISIKQIAQEETAVSVSPKVKENLMQLMEEKANRVPWYTWNGIAAFLFPANTPLFRKPGLQFAVMGLLLLLVVNIGINEFGNKNKQLAINAKKEVKNSENSSKNGEITQEPAIIEEVENETSDNEANFDNKTNGKDIDLNETDKVELKERVAPAPAIVEVQAQDMMDEVSEEVEEIVIPTHAKDVKLQEKVLRSQPKVESETNIVSDDSYNAVTLSEVNIPDTKSVSRLKKNSSSNSQSLSDQEAVIDLLFVTL